MFVDITNLTEAYYYKVLLHIPYLIPIKKSLISICRISRITYDFEHWFQTVVTISNKPDTSKLFGMREFVIWGADLLGPILSTF